MGIHLLKSHVGYDLYNLVLELNPLQIMVESTLEWILRIERRITLQNDANRNYIRIMYRIIVLFAQSCRFVMDKAI